MFILPCSIMFVLNLTVCNFHHLVPYFDLLVQIFYLTLSLFTVYLRNVTKTHFSVFIHLHKILFFSHGNMHFCWS